MHGDDLVGSDLRVGRPRAAQPGIAADGLRPPVVRDVEFIDYAPGASGTALGVRFEEDEAEYEQLLRDLLDVGMVVTIRDASVSESSVVG